MAFDFILRNAILFTTKFSYFVQGEKKQTNYHRTMLGELVRGIIPANWHRYTIPKGGCTVIQWITDFSQRVKQLQKISQLVSTAGAKELQVRTFN